MITLTYGTLFTLSPFLFSRYLVTRIMHFKVNFLYHNILMVLCSDIDFNKMAIEHYVNQNETRLTFEQKEARAALKTWREMV